MDDQPPNAPLHARVLDVLGGARRWLLDRSGADRLLSLRSVRRARRSACYLWTSLADRIDPCGPWSGLREVHRSWPREWFVVDPDDLMHDWADPDDPLEESAW